MSETESSQTMDSEDNASTASTRGSESDDDPWLQLVDEAMIKA